MSLLFFRLHFFNRLIILEDGVWSLEKRLKWGTKIAKKGRGQKARGGRGKKWEKFIDGRRLN